MDDVVFSHNRAEVMPIRHMLKVIHQGQQGFDATRAKSGLIFSIALLMHTFIRNECRDIQNQVEHKM